MKGNYRSVVIKKFRWSAIDFSLQSRRVAQLFLSATSTYRERQSILFTSVKIILLHLHYFEAIIAINTFLVSLLHRFRYFRTLSYIAMSLIDISQETIIFHCAVPYYFFS